ncbi:hypothetical protein ISF_04642 [Cordyceps fumosorosea ARSEF 2679]|uniref:Uncharacterized protein n=1 Tax=Cordyceps fumosorosea (strain ARSEF 2679) TaxID=1081104 RepID=A0A167WLB7_CORFA|nr:hypothetical protein ISF_04642 [Cordyceps fumosorosea ARSEF 2679]OAA63933.1 hypothetical protein ISF_04642 [Cordyceps fumosorosea ARSEF 2679]
MASYYPYGAMPAQPGPVSHNHHGGRNRRTARLSVSQNSQRQFRGVRGFKEMNESAALSAFRTKFEAVRSFDLEDDMEFCPGLLTETDVSSDRSSGASSPALSDKYQLVSISSSERSSLASNSPESSPTQQPQSITPGFSLNSASPSFVPPSLQNQQPTFKLHQPSARGRNAIPIINPITGVTMSSPPPSAPPSVSPMRMPQHPMRRW